ncbi:hypothetical protein PHACT_02860 [Pseudohongiella acticola]|jgi:hypothetical protein|uniref:Outer membrane protein beta-barrel domain-containing protein n=1 Tax=Pseudohongiella acticola TaxID=1524254 RepID=A0A1E8CIF5_9GAMM|nr:outer membrane beta-barrel protein [Pseudohongiella acticola]OFE12203.1 hypothetical protein PHACT_02860 [Pseudohongiella acticola]
MKLKKSAILMSAVLMTGSGYTLAQDTNWTPMLDQGTKEVSISGRLEFPDFDKLDYDLDGSYGYFLQDGWEVGAQLGAADFGGVDRLDVGVFTEYNFNRDSRWVPYVGAAIGLGSVSFDDGDFDAESDLDDGDGAVFDIETGVKWFVRPYMAISTAINFQLATDDVFATDDSIEDNITTLQIGMRFYF